MIRFSVRGGEPLFEMIKDLLEVRTHLQLHVLNFVQL